MKKLLLTVLLGMALMPQWLRAQEVRKLLFRHRCVPTSTTDYQLEISRDGYVLTRNERRPARQQGRTLKNNISTYTQAFDTAQQAHVARIIRTHQLDSVGSYQQRTTQWGTLWEVVIERQSITYTIGLPNYSNAGLQALLGYVLCLIPKKERLPTGCKTCE